MINKNWIEDPEKVWLVDVDNTLYQNDLLGEILENRYVEYLKNLLNFSEPLSREVNKYLYSNYHQSGIGAMRENLISKDQLTEYVNYVHDINLPPSLTANKSVLSIIKNAKGRKFIFSNSIASYINKILAKFEITNEFEKVYDIFEFQLKCKPDPIVFDIVSKEHNINTSNFILIDDSEKTLESARRYGIDVINPIDLDYVYEQ